MPCGMRTACSSRELAVRDSAFAVGDLSLKTLGALQVRFEVWEVPSSTSNCENGKGAG